MRFLTDETISNAGLRCGVRRVAKKPIRSAIYRGIFMHAICVAALSAPALAPADAGSPPAALYGKSVVVTWSEARSLRPAGSDLPFHSVNASYELGTYVSTAGRAFSRTSLTAGGRTGSIDNVGGSGHSSTGGLRTVEFQGNSLTTSAAFQGGARRIVVNFGEGFANCTAEVVIAKQVGARTMTVTGLLGRTIEIESATAGPASCSVRSGNVFGE
jgi:hypothetical protein